MGNRQNCAKFQENIFRSNEIISIFCPPLFRKRPINKKLSDQLNAETCFLIFEDLHLNYAVCSQNK